MKQALQDIPSQAEVAEKELSVVCPTLLYIPSVWGRRIAWANMRLNEHGYQKSPDAHPP